ncbi:HPr family phosphocarrier protein [Blautia sp. An46]|uniref:HPr family phosphocarrier protein n=1 Tax=Blautia sp. An46 TaxID=1965636 RepID=UPI000B39442E|nr:HPr family phosphocarrier protein [Blautia sp. An46]OUN91010.1 PTS galactitol transporter subunit IIC [Blautia sp. An46]HJD36115.1 HPr family phosphocarrier protein [Candidatus Blautia ornithocaccae]
MKNFEYTIKDELGIHARPAGMLVKEAKKYQSKITITKEGKTAEASKLMAVMSLGVKCGQTVQIAVEGADEEAAAAGIQAFFEANL